MNIYIMTDIEGISGIYTPDQVMENGSRFREGREYMTQDINACAEGCKAAGAERVYVRDCHGGSWSVIWERLSEAVDYCVCGSTGDERFPGLDDCDGVILLGYHAMAGTHGGILEHTMSSKAYQNYWVNGARVGETAIDAALVGERGKPVIMVSGDDKLCAEARALLPWVVTAEVKRGITWRGGLLLPPERAHRLIREKSAEAVARADGAKRFVYDKPVRIRIELVERGVLPSAYAKPYMRQIDDRTYEVEGDTMAEALFRA